MGCYVVGMTYRIDMTLVIAITGGFMIALSLTFATITFFSLKTEEEIDTATLCQLQNRIKKERTQQDCYSRMSLKLTEMNWGRSQDEIDQNFLFRVNQIRGQSNTFMNAANLVRDPN